MLTRELFLRLPQNGLVFTAEGKHGRLHGKDSLSPRQVVAQRHPLTFLHVPCVSHPNGQTLCQRGATTAMA